MNPQQPPITRIPLDATIRARDEFSDADARAVNAYKEVGRGRQYAIKRPGSFSLYTGLGSAGQGVFSFGGALFSVNSDVLHNLTTSSTYSL